MTHVCTILVEPGRPPLVAGPVVPAVVPGFVGRGGEPGVYDYGDYGFDTGLPRCSYINTDFFGDDVGDGRGLVARSPYDCKRVGKMTRSRMRRPS